MAAVTARHSETGNRASAAGGTLPPPRWRRRRETLKGLALVAPALAIVVVVKYFPLYLGIRTSFTNASPRGSESVGWKNYQDALDDEVFQQSLSNAGKGLLALPLFILVPLVIAYMLHMRTPGWRSFRNIFFFASLVPSALVAIVFVLILGPSGPLVRIGDSLGVDSLSDSPLASLNGALIAVFAVALWSFFGLGVLTYMASMTSIPVDLFHAAKIDGAGPIRQFTVVCVPSILPTIAYWAVVSTSGLLIWLFPIIFNLTGGGPGYSSTTPEVYIWRIFGEQLRYGYASALGVYLFALVFVVSFIQVWILWSRNEDE